MGSSAGVREGVVELVSREWRERFRKERVRLGLRELPLGRGRGGLGRG